MILNVKKIVAFLISTLAVTNLFVGLVQLNDSWLLRVLILLSASFLPGVALLWALRVKPGSVLVGALYSFGLSVLMLMLSGLVANQILFAMNAAHPLELAGVLGVWNIIVALCVTVGAMVNQRHMLPVPPLRWSRTTGIMWAMMAVATLLPALAAGGAFRLNNGGDEAVAVLTIGAVGAVIAGLFLLRNRLPEAALGWGIFMISLAILLMTSLRSWDISGHDVAREFHVYTLMHNTGHWDFGAFEDAYNACLSITILPEMYAKLLHTSGLVSFKLILQIIFAVCPVVIYALARRFVSKLAALVAVALFISYPTFINDSAMLTRQGVAYLFFSLALLVAIRPRQERVHRLLFLLYSAGAVLSHYSTAYMMVVILAGALLIKLAARRPRGWTEWLIGNRRTVLSPAIVAVVAMVTFLWYAPVSGGLVTVLSASVANVPHLLSDENRSADTSVALLLSSHKTQADVYESYLAHPIITSNTIESAQYRPEITADDIPLTPLGAWLSELGVQPSITSDLRQNFAKVLQLLAVASVLYMGFLFVRKKAGHLSPDLLYLSLTGIAVVVCMVVLPSVSLSYGVLRAFQQSLIFLVIPLVLLLAVGGRLIGRRLRLGLATASMVALFFLFSGLFAQMTGGTGATLALNNRGLYYGLYYATEADLRAYAWLKSYLPAGSNVRAASFTKAIMHDPAYPFKQVGILPSQRPASAFVYLDHAQVQARKLYVYHDGSPLIMTFPLNYYSDQTNHIYSTTSTAVYH